MGGADEAVCLVISSFSHRNTPARETQTEKKKALSMHDARSPCVAAISSDTWRRSETSSVLAAGRTCALLLKNMRRNLQPVTTPATFFVRSRIEFYTVLIHALLTHVTGHASRSTCLVPHAHSYPNPPRTGRAFLVAHISCLAIFIRDIDQSIQQ